MKSTNKRYILLHLGMVVTLLFVSAIAKAFQVDEIYYNIVSASDRTCEVTYYSTEAGENSSHYKGGIAIPSIVNNPSDGKDYAVVGIGKYAFYYCSKIEWVTIPETVTSIGNNAFCQCNGLSEILIPKDVTSIGNYAFTGCYGLSEISIPSKVESIGRDAFYNCNQISTITIPSSVTSIGANAFYGCPLTTVTLEEGAETLDMSATLQKNTSFYECPIETLYLGRQISYTDSYSPFKDITSLTSLTITDNVTSIGQYMFYGCKGLTGELIIPNSITSIGEYAFQGCTGLTDVTIPESVTSIGSYAFYNCNLNELYFFGSLDSYYLVFQGLTCETLYAHEDQIDAIKAEYSGTVLPLEDVYTISAENIYPRSIVLKANLNEKLLVDGVSLKSVKVGTTELIEDSDGLYIATNLIPNQTYTCTLTFMYGTEERTSEIEVTTENFYGEATLQSTTPTSLTFAITLNEDTYSSPPDEYGLLYNGTYYATDENGVAKITGLQKSTEYTFELYAKYGNNVVMGESITATTQIVIDPTVTTLSATDITFRSAVLNATITAGDEEILEQGFMYYNDNDNNQIYTVEGSGEDMSITITDLEYYTYYYYWAYARTETGVTYGEVCSFRTRNYFAPDATTKNAYNITSSTATLRGYLPEPSEEILERGFEYWITEDDVQIIVVEGYSPKTFGDFEVTVTGLTPSTTYNYRAYVKTELVHSYGSTLTFTTEWKGYDLYPELYDEIWSTLGYFNEFVIKYSDSEYDYLPEILYMDEQITALFDKLENAYNDGSLDDDLAEEIRSELEVLRNWVDSLYVSKLYEELMIETISTEELLESAWKTITTDYADVADEFEDDYKDILDELSELAEEFVEAYKAGELDKELAESIEDSLEEINQEIEDLLAAAKQAHTSGISSIFIDLGDDVQIYNLSGVRVDTPTKGNIYIIRYSDGITKKVFLK